MPFHHMPCPDYQAQPTHGGPNGIASFNVVLGLSSIRRFGVMLSQGFERIQQVSRAVC